jgi:hypothetical protein
MQDDHSEKHSLIKIRKPEIDPLSNEIILQKFIENYIPKHLIPQPKVEDFKNQV